MLYTEMFTVEFMALPEHIIRQFNFIIVGWLLIVVVFYTSFVFHLTNEPFSYLAPKTLGIFLHKI